MVKSEIKKDKVIIPENKNDEETTVINLDTIENTGK